MDEQRLFIEFARRQGVALARGRSLWLKSTDDQRQAIIAQITEVSPTNYTLGELIADIRAKEEDDKGASDLTDEDIGTPTN